MIALPRLYAIADGSFSDPVLQAASLFAGGAMLLQVRNKNASSRELLRQVEEIVRIAPRGSLVLVNDRPDIARLAGAAGVHLGQHDLPVAEARKVLGQDSIIGISTHNLSQAVEADRSSATYIAGGPIYQTSTKQNPDPIIGLAGLSEICKAVHKPVVAIGGIRLENIHDVLAAGASSIAVIRDLLSATDISSRTRQWVAECERYT